MMMNMKRLRLCLFQGFLLSPVVFVVGCPDGTHGEQRQNQQGTWTGTASYGQASLAVELELEDSSWGMIDGRWKIGDPVTNVMVPLGALSGTLTKDRATWQAFDGRVTATGVFVGDTFAGTIVFPPNSIQPTGLITSVRLSRVP